MCTRTRGETAKPEKEQGRERTTQHEGWLRARIFSTQFEIVSFIEIDMHRASF